MKKLLFFPALFLAIGLFAQVEKGTVAVSFNSYKPYTENLYDVLLSKPVNGLGAGYFTTKYGEEDEEGDGRFSAGFSSNFHYFVADNFSVGPLLGAVMVSDDGNQLFHFTVGPQFYYHIPLATNLMLNLNANGSYGWLNQKYDGEWADAITTISFKAGAAISIFPAPCFAIDLGAGYRHSDLIMDGESMLTSSGVCGEIGFTLLIK